MKIGVPTEINPTENRVAMSPKTAQKLIKKGFKVAVQSGAGEKAQFSDQDFKDCGVEVIGSAESLWSEADILLKVSPPNTSEIDLGHENQLIIGILEGSDNQELFRKIADKNMSAIAMDSIPRISRAQKMDVLSSMANIAGYRAVITASQIFGRFFSGQITAAGKIEPAKVLVIGAGVAGLSAIGTAKNLGAIVRAFDTRSDVAEQIQSMGAEFLYVDIEEDGSTDSGYSKVMSEQFIAAEMDLFRKQAAEVDIVISTALIPGRPAPKLWLKDMVEIMKPGSIIVDLAYPRGGNCELTKPGEVYTTPGGVTIIGTLDQMACQASQLYSSNCAHLIEDMGDAEKFKIDLSDDVINGSLVVHKGEVRWPPPKISVKAKPNTSENATTTPESSPQPKIQKKNSASGLIWLIGLGIFLALLGPIAPAKFLSHFTVFVLSVFIGWQIIWNVAPALHTPLMSVTNAISGIILIGGILHVGAEFNGVTTLSLIAVFVASINVFGGFVVTHRMLKMFQKGRS